MSSAEKTGQIDIRREHRQVLVDEQLVAVPARAYDVLIALVDYRERVVSKDELLDLVWPGVVVEDHNLHTQVSTLHKLIGVRAIATVPGRGYRFVGHIRAGTEPCLLYTSDAADE